MSVLAYGAGLNTVAKVKSRSRHTALIISADAQFTALWLALAQRAGCFVIRRAPGEVPVDEAVDLVVIDLDAPDFDAAACVAGLRAGTAELDLPWIIGVKTGIGEDDADAAMAAGMNDLVGRTGGAEVFLQALEGADRALHERGTV
jgi:CheY-like chemotaxis protein